MMAKYVVAVPGYKDEAGVEQVRPGYIEGLRRIGATPLLIREAFPHDHIDMLTDMIDGLLLPGGDDVNPCIYGAEPHPRTEAVAMIHDELEIRLIHRCIAKRVPILGICRGCQILNVALGGTLTQDIPDRYGTSHWIPKDSKKAHLHHVRVIPDTMLGKTLGGDVAVNSYHHQCIEKIATGVVVSAYAPEGFPEAFENKAGESFCMGVQWHPEVTLNHDMFSERIFQRFGKAIAERIR